MSVLAYLVIFVMIVGLLILVSNLLFKSQENELNCDFTEQVYPKIELAVDRYISDVFQNEIIASDEAIREAAEHYSGRVSSQYFEGQEYIWEINPITNWSNMQVISESCRPVIGEIVIIGPEYIDDIGMKKSLESVFYISTTGYYYEWKILDIKPVLGTYRLPVEDPGLVKVNKDLRLWRSGLYYDEENSYYYIYVFNQSRWWIRPLSDSQAKQLASFPRP